MIDLDRLRELAREPERTAMQRTGQMPTMTSEVLRQKQEITALRRGLNEAIVEIERLEKSLRWLSRNDANGWIKAKVKKVLG